MPMVRVGGVDLREARPVVWIRVMVAEQVGSQQVPFVRGKLVPDANLPLHYHPTEEAFTIISGGGSPRSTASSRGSGPVMLC